MDFAKYIDETYPEHPGCLCHNSCFLSIFVALPMKFLEPRQQYATRLTTGPHCIRPFNLGFRRGNGSTKLDRNHSLSTMMISLSQQ